MANIFTTNIESDVRILYNNIGTKNLPSANIHSDSVSSVGGDKYIPAGSFISVIKGTTLHRATPRGKLISKYTAGQTSVIVKNPSVFKPGDILYLISPAGTPRYQELQSIRSGSAPIFGTVTAVDGSSSKQETTITPSTVIVGNVITLVISHITLTYTVTDAAIATVIAGLKAAFDKLKGNTSTWEFLDAVASPTELKISSRQSGHIFEVIASGSAGSASTAPTITTSISKGVGALTITPGAGNAAAEVGTKLGSIDDVVVGITAHTYHFSDAETSQDKDMVIAPYNAAMINLKALPYIDADIVEQVQELSYTPPYGA